MWGIEGGLPSMPHGLSITRAGAAKPKSGSAPSSPTCRSGKATSSAVRPPAAAASAIRWSATRPSCIEDVADDYVSVERAAKDYGVSCITVIDAETLRIRDRRSRDRRLARERSEASASAGSRPIPRKSWPAYRAGEIDELDVMRRYAVMLDWDTGALLPISTGQFREMFHKRSAANWAKVGGA